MKAFEDLENIIDKLFGPGGCPWDQKQTLTSLEPYFVEELHELVEALDSKDKEKIVEELGDLLHTIVFFSKVAEKEGQFSLEEVIKNLCQKLIRRHPHVFKKGKAKDVKSVIATWEKIKKKEKSHQKRKSVLDGIPPTLPLLMKAQKTLHKMHKKDAPFWMKKPRAKSRKGVEEALIQLLVDAEAQEIDLEGFLRKALKQQVENFRKWEKEEERR